MDKIAEFYGKVMADKDLHAKLSEILANKPIVDASDEELQKIGALAKTLGFDIDLSEAKAYLQSDMAKVSDEALDAVAGGKGQKVRCKGKDAGQIYDRKTGEYRDRKLEADRELHEYIQKNKIKIGGIV